MKHLIILAALLFSSTVNADSEDEVRTLGRGVGILIACGDADLADKVFAAGLKKATVKNRWTKQETKNVLQQETLETKYRYYTKSECENYKLALHEVIYIVAP